MIGLAFLLAFYVVQKPRGHRVLRAETDGDTVRALAESMEDSALSMERRLAGSHGRLEGILRISSADWFAGYVLAPVPAELGRRHPAVVPEVIASYRLLDLSRRDADVAFRIGPFSAMTCMPSISCKRRIGEREHLLYKASSTFLCAGSS